MCNIFSIAVLLIQFCRVLGFIFYKLSYYVKRQCQLLVTSVIVGLGYPRLFQIFLPCGGFSGFYCQGGPYLCYACLVRPEQDQAGRSSFLYMCMMNLCLCSLPPFVLLTQPFVLLNLLLLKLMCGIKLLLLSGTPSGGG